MSVIDRAKSHFESLGTQSMEVPEWKDDDGNPTVIYWNPITLAEKKINQIEKLHDKESLLCEEVKDLVSEIREEDIEENDDIEDEDFEDEEIEEDIDEEEEKD